MNERDDLKRKEEHNKIRGNQAEEVRELCRQYGTSPDRLKAALRAVGYDGEKVRRYLKGERVR